MKYLYKIVLVLSFVMLGNLAYSQDTVTNTLGNFFISGGGTKFSYDIFTLRNTPAEFRMGSSSFYVKYNGGTMNNPVLTNVNPKYTAGSVTNSYNAMFGVINGSFSTVGVQLLYAGPGPGDVITSDPGVTGVGERVATVTLNILSATSIHMFWDSLVNSAVVNPTGTITAHSRYFGSYTGTLPVELSSFTSAINRNNVTLNWTTTNEINNNGFDIERKIVNDNSEWTKIGFVNGSGNSHENMSYNYKDNNLTIGKYSYRLKQVDFNGNFEYFNLGNEVVVGIPTQFELSQNYPNPFNPATKINFSLPSDSKVTLNVYDISGRLISTLLNNEFKAANYYTVTFNGSNLSSGAYFYSLQTDKNTETKKMVLIK